MPGSTLADDLGGPLPVCPNASGRDPLNRIAAPPICPSRRRQSFAGEADHPSRPRRVMKSPARRLDSGRGRPGRRAPRVRPSDRGCSGRRLLGDGATRMVGFTVVLLRGSFHGAHPSLRSSSSWSCSAIIGGASALQRDRTSHRRMDGPADRGRLPGRDCVVLSPPRSRPSLRPRLPATRDGDADSRSAHGRT